MDMYPDVRRISGEVRRLRGGLSDLAQGFQKSFWRAEDDAEEAGNRAWAVARPYASRALTRVEENPVTAASVVVGIAAFAGAFFLLRDLVLPHLLSQRKSVRRKRRAVAAAAAPKPRTRKGPSRPRRSRAPTA